jgi:hypothetical protein
MFSFEYYNMLIGGDRGWKKTFFDWVWLRNNILGKIILNDEYISLPTSDRLAYLLNNYPRKSAKYIVNSYLHRRTTLYMT